MKLPRPIRQARLVVRDFFRFIDPVMEPGAPRTPLAFVVCFASLSILTAWMLIRGKYLPGTDMPYHALCSRVWMQAGVPGTPYAAYEPRHILEANTLLYSAVSVLANVFQPFTAYRIANAWYFFGVPIACLYALRAFNRPLWGSLLGFPLCYNESFSSGYVNFNFAAPWFIFAIVEYVRFTKRPTLLRGVVTGVLFLFVFLSHAQVYLWLGAIIAVLTIGALVRCFIETHGFVRGLKKAAWLAFLCIAVSALSLSAFYPWYQRGYGQGHAVGGEFNQSSISWIPLVTKLTGMIAQTFASSLHPYEYHLILGLGIVIAFSWSFGRAARDRTSMIPELVLILTAVSCYVVPDYVATQYVAPRQWYVTGWLLPLTIAPVAYRVSPGRSLTVIGCILLWVGMRMTMIADYMAKTNDEEMKGLDHVAKTAPKELGLLITYAAPDPNSKYFKTSYGHTYAFLAAENGWDSPLDATNQNDVRPVRYHEGAPLPIARSFSNPNWYMDPTIWRYDLVLVRRWTSTKDQRKAAQSYGTLVTASDDWELWRRNP